MYIDSISLENVRTFAAEKTISFVHPDNYLPISDAGKQRPPRFKNVNLLFGDNASGKTTLLEAIALASLGPAITDSRISPRPLVRFVPKERRPSPREKAKEARILANLVLHGKEIKGGHSGAPPAEGVSHLFVRQKGDLEGFECQVREVVNWDAVYRSRGEAFFVVAYGATRRIEQKSELSFSKRRSSSFARVSRIESIVQEGYPLVPFQAWLPSIRRGSNRWHEVIDLINRALGRGHFTFDGRQTSRGTEDYVFSQGGLDIPSRSLSDGYRAFLGWIGDLLFHLHFACRKSEYALSDIPGVVLVDEIDLHLHPRWQMDVIRNLSRTFPRLQFIFTSHSPLIAGSVEWMNITHLHLDRQHRTGVNPFEDPIYGLDADQILVSDLFGLETTRAQPKQDRLNSLTIRARRGDKSAAKQLIAEMARGLEGEE